MNRAPSRLLRLRLTSARSYATAHAKSGTSRFDRVIARTPTQFLRTRMQAFRNAPLTTTTSFLLLHEITAVVPLFGLAAAFHYYEWLPPFFAEGAWVLRGVTLFGNYFRRKGWISDTDAKNAKDAAEKGQAEDVEKGAKAGVIGKWWNRGEGGTRLVIEFATAYAVVKALLPIRIVISVWGAPWFARYSVIPLQNLWKRIFARKNVSKGFGGVGGSKG